MIQCVCSAVGQRDAITFIKDQLDGRDLSDPKATRGVSAAFYREHHPDGKPACGACAKAMKELIQEVAEGMGAAAADGSRRSAAGKTGWTQGLTASPTGPATPSPAPPRPASPPAPLRAR